MYSKKSLQILFDFKYQLYSSASYQYNEAPEDKKRREQSIEALKKAAKTGDEGGFKYEFMYLFGRYKKIIEKSIDQKTNKDLKTRIMQMLPNYQKKLGNLGLDTEFSDFINKDVMAFFAEETAKDVFDLYGNLGEKEETTPKDKSSFLSRMMSNARRFYQKKQWQYWYWPNLYYGKLSLRLVPYLLSELIASVMYICGFSVMIALMISFLATHLPFSPAILVYSLITSLMTGFALTVPKTTLEKFLLLLVVAGIAALLIFCPPLSIGVILGLTLSVFQNIALTSAFGVGCIVISKAIQAKIKPESNYDIDALFSGSNNTQFVKEDIDGIELQAQDTQQTIDETLQRINLYLKTHRNPSSSPIGLIKQDLEGDGGVSTATKPTSKS